MNEYPVRGRFRFRQDDFERDFAYVKSRVSEVSTPQLKGVPGQERVQFWWADFAATAEQWRILEPEVLARGIYAPINEDFQMHVEADLAEARYQSELEKRTGRQLPMVTLGMVILIVSLFLLGRYGWPAIILWVIALGLIAFGMQGTVTPQEYFRRWNEAVIRAMVRRNSRGGLAHDERQEKR